MITLDKSNLDSFVDLATYDRAVTGMGQYAAMLHNGTSPVLAWQPQFAQVASSADMGWTWGNYQYSYDNAEGERGIAHGKYLNVWRKDAERGWIVLVDMGNSSPQPE